MFRIAIAAACAVAVACATTSVRFPWPAQGPALSATRADVTTVGGSYRRTTSQVLVRKISRPSRASLDYAAYHANFMNADPAPEGANSKEGKTPKATNPFRGVLAANSLTGSIASTSLTPDERAHALALPPLVELLTSKHVAGADRLEETVAQIRAENWGLAGGPQIVRQTATELFVHDPGPQRPAELWIKVEFAPWFAGFSSAPDEDGDGYAEIYGRVAEAEPASTQAIVRFIRNDYEGKVLGASEVKAWAHQLASYWYPSYNTDLVAAPTGWPADDTEPAIRQELGPLTFSAPTIVMRGKPMGNPVYNVFLVEGTASEGDKATPNNAPATLNLPPSVPSPNPAPNAKAIETELAAHGRSWTAWSAELTALHASLKKRLGNLPSGARAIKGSDGYLFFRQSLAYVLGGDLGQQPGDRNPIPVIVEFQKLLAKRGVDFLFVPVPTKVEIFPEKTGQGPAQAKLARFAGKIVNPYQRKFVQDLSDRGVEVLDLLPTFLAERNARASEPLYQVQDTHWTSRGLELAARLVAERIKNYGWYKGLAPDRRAYTTKDESFTRHGDLVSRLPEAERAGISPETLVGHQIISPDGSLYDDDPDSPIVLLGDSFTGVYQLMDCEHAGVSAHLAKELGYPVDLVMSYGGGPNVREKLLKRGLDKLKGKKLVIWMMTARDLYDHAEGWQPVEKPVERE
jgi:hypothetical protein